MTYKPYNENLNTTTQQNPHSPASSGYKQQPVEIPGVLHQTRELFQPVIAIPPEGQEIMPQANVDTRASAQAWFTDKARISTGSNTVTFQVEAVQLTYQNPATGNWANAGTVVGNIYSNAVAVPSNSRQDIYVGVGNKLTVVGGNVTIQELGTASSATAGENGVGNG